MQPKKTDQPAPHAGEREKTTGEGEYRSTPSEEGSGEAIPPLPEPDVEGVGEESGPSAGKTGLTGEKLSPEARKMAEDGTGF
jgi:hypothetical protein